MIILDTNVVSEMARPDMDVRVKAWFGSQRIDDDRAARAYGMLLAAARAEGKSVLMADGQIAAIAAVQGFTIATRDTAPFEAAGIPVIDPWMM
jgi:predicted nucleic acid-binding protein